MSTKSNVLAYLLKKSGEPLSGADIAEKLGVSRNAVWKAVNELRNEGYEISAVTNTGYALLKESTHDIISAESINNLLCGADFPFNIKVFDELPSTNTYAKELANNNAPHGTIIIAKKQTAGKGRYGREFHSPPYTGLYMSIIIKPREFVSFALENPTLITAYTAVAVCHAVERIYEKTPVIKWVNDIFFNEKKICGILTEATSNFETNEVQWIVVGIGVNITGDNFPNELKKIAGSILSEKEISKNISPDKNIFAAEIIRGILSKTELDKKTMLNEYKDRLFILGKNITVHRGENSYGAIAVDIDENAALIIKNENGETETLFSGEVSIKI